MTDDVARNRELWTRTNVEYTDQEAARQWSQEEITWGVWGVPERELRVLPEVGGLDVVEVGCGTAYVSAWLARRGAHVVGVDITPAQLETARRCQVEFGLEFPLIEASAEDVPLADASFDLVVSEYGASIWCDPSGWVPEAARLLRPGGRLVFLRNSTLVILCTPDEGQAEERLLRPQFGMYRLEWPGEGVEFHLGHGEWIRRLRASGFEIENLVEIQAPPDAETHPVYDYVSAEWGRHWPAEEIWVARKR
ncbi:MAG: class I SAM-dependent methyltransferase [Gaiellaceae bacterium]